MAGQFGCVPGAGREPAAQVHLTVGPADDLVVGGEDADVAAGKHVDLRARAAEPVAINELLDDATAGGEILQVPRRQRSHGIAQRLLAQFLASNANTGASTLSTTSTGTRNLVDASGAVLAGGQIKANTVVEVTYDGTRFLLSKRLFNDRILVVDSN